MADLGENAGFGLRAEDADFDTFLAQVSRSTDPGEVPLAAEVIRNIPIYDGAAVTRAQESAQARQALMAEWAAVLGRGAGVVVIRQALTDHGVIDRASEIFDAIITRERAQNQGGGDHFAKPGANDRIWNSLEKHCLADPANFAAYYSPAALALASEAWLGPAYQVTAQVNRVNPSGAAQVPHRDYHLGFMSAAQMARYPAHIHGLSPVLTLQGGLAHSDMPVETGPTMVLPFSQLFHAGYLAFGEAPYQAHFADHHVQLPLAKGDAIFFNPAVMHGAGTNRTKDRLRLVNLFQVSSAFGRAMESVNRHRMARAVYPALQHPEPGVHVENVIAATAEGYAFPTNLDSNPPVGGLAPKSQADLMREALAEGQSAEEFGKALDALAARNLA